jgi:diguanylate cyclase (GGDEF)-like protein
LSGLRSAYAREKILARTDPLTGVTNTKYFYYLAGQEIDRAARYIHPFSVAYMDLDNFKEVNDRFGHDAGDDVLRLVTTTIAKNIRKTDIIARLGGDEFILLFPETGAEDARVVMEKLKGLLLHNMQERQRQVTFSIGLVTYTVAPESVEDMVKEADRLMYTVKNSTKNAIGQEIF